MQFNAILSISCNSMVIFRTFFNENNDLKKHEIAIKILII